MRPDSVKGDSAPLIRIDPLVQHVAQESSILRDPLADHAPRVHDRVRIVLDVGSEVADRCEPESGDGWVRHHVDVLLDPPRLESTIEMNMPGARLAAAVYHTP